MFIFKAEQHPDPLEPSLHFLGSEEEVTHLNRFLLAGTLGALAVKKPGTTTSLANFAILNLSRPMYSRQVPEHLTDEVITILGHQEDIEANLDHRHDQLVKTAAAGHLTMQQLLEGTSELRNLQQSEFPQWLLPNGLHASWHKGRLIPTAYEIVEGSPVTSEGDLEWSMAQEVGADSFVHQEIVRPDPGRPKEFTILPGSHITLGRSLENDDFEPLVTFPPLPQ